MSLVLWPRTQGTATPVVSGGTPDVPLIHARIAWRGEGFTLAAYDGSSTGWITNGSSVSGPVTSLSETTSDTFGGGTALQVVTAGTAGSGVDYPVAGTAVAGRTYRYRVALRSISGSTSTALRVGNASDFAATTATITTGWAWYTLDWTPGTAVADGRLSIRNGAAATQTTGIDHPELYEKNDEVILESLKVSRGSRFDGAKETPGTLDLTVLDPSLVYTPRNTASPIYGEVEDGREVHIRAVWQGRLYPIAYGVLDRVTPLPDERKLSCSATDGLGELDGYQTSREFATDRAYHTVRSQVLASVGISGDLATDGIESDTFADGTDSSTSALDYLDQLNEATGSLHVCAPQVNAYTPWRYRTISRTTLTGPQNDAFIDDDFQRLSDVDIRRESRITRQRVSWVGYERRPYQVVARATEDEPYLHYTDEEYGSSNTPEPEYIFELRRRFVWKRVKDDKGRVTRKRRQRRKLKRVGVRWVDAILPITIPDGTTSEDVVIDFKVPVEGTEITYDGTVDDVTETEVTEPARHTVTFTASGGDGEVTSLTVYGEPHMPLTEQEEVVTNGTYIREGNPIDNECIVSAGQAYGLAAYLTWRYGTARLRPQVTDQHHMSRQLTLDVGSHVTLSADRWLIDGVRFVVRSVEHDVSGKGFEWETTWGLEELPTSLDWFTLGSSALDGAAVLAY